VATRTRTDTTTIEVKRAVKEQLTVYQAVLHRDFGRQTTISGLIGALLEGVPHWQAEAMLRAYRPKGEHREGPEKDQG
jgi:hypothetical protein